MTQFTLPLKALTSMAPLTAKNGDKRTHLHCIHFEAIDGAVYLTATNGGGLACLKAAQASAEGYTGAFSFPSALLPRLRLKTCRQDVAYACIDTEARTVHLAAVAVTDPTAEMVKLAAESVVRWSESDDVIGVFPNWRAQILPYVTLASGESRAFDLKLLADFRGLTEGDATVRFGRVGGLNGKACVLIRAESGLGETFGILMALAASPLESAFPDWLPAPATQSQEEGAAP